MQYLNLGCGRQYHPAWTNVDFVSTGEGVMAHNLRQGLPFPDNSFDGVYHSHVLEHFPQPEASDFLQECYRVLRPQGLLRVVIPDLEQIARLYLTALEQASQGASEWAAHYDWMMLELYDQVVRDRPGGAMARYLARETIPHQAFVIQRLGREAKNLIEALQQNPQALPSVTPPPSERELLLQTLLGDDDYQALNLGRFRQSGEVHQWMYDRHSLTLLLTAVGFDQIHPCAAHESAIPAFADYHLDVEADGQIRKPDSLFMEARKPQISIPSYQPNRISASDRPVPAAPKSLQDLPPVQELQQTVHQLQVKLERSQAKLRQIKQQLAESQQTIQSMERSKFWRVRSRWIALKQALGWIHRN